MRTMKDILDYEYISEARRAKIPSIQKMIDSLMDKVFKRFEKEGEKFAKALTSNTDMKFIFKECYADDKSPNMFTFSYSVFYKDKERGKESRSITNTLEVLIEKGDIFPDDITSYEVKKTSSGADLYLYYTIDSNI